MKKIAIRVVTPVVAVLSTFVALETAARIYGGGLPLAELLG